MASEEPTAEFFDNLLFVKLFQTFRMAIQPSKLIIAFLAVAVICLAGWIMDFSNTVVAAPTGETELQVYLASPDQMELFIETNEKTGRQTGVFATLWSFASTSFKGSVDSLFTFNLLGVAANIADYFRAVGWAVRYHLVYCIMFFLIILAVISIGGGAICRISALQFAKGEKPGLTEALRFSTKKFFSFFTAPLAPLGIIVFMGLFLLVLGLIGNIPWIGELVIAIFMPLALIGGVLITVISIGAVAGFNLMFPAVAYDGSDCFDAISRSFSYVYAKPWRMGFYTAIAAVYGAICYTFVRLFAFLLLLVTRLFLRCGVWAESSEQVNKLEAIWPAPDFMNLLGSSTVTTANWTQSFSAFLIQLSVLVVVGLIVSFIISFYFSANTIIYAVLRNQVDDTALDDVYTYREDVLPEPADTESVDTEPASDESQAQTDSE